MAEIDASTIAENATKPRKASSDGTSAEQHSLADQIAAAKFNASTSAVQGRRTPRLMINKAKPPGAV